jgi:formylglycine-generating enzyme required for sulfatase activity
VLPGERWAHEVDVPEGEIDAQAVDWSQFVEFAEDGGYDDPRWWSPEGWDWLQREGRRAPRGVEQLRGGVLLQRAGRVTRAAAGLGALHVTWHEADAWCRWAGRRLPTEPEWELAACTASSRGFVWGDALEWVAGRARPWPGGESPVAGFGPWPPPGDTVLRVLRGASSWTVPRARHPRARRFVAPERDDLFAGFRSCAL